MRKIGLIVILGVMALSWLDASEAQAHRKRNAHVARRFAATRAWHGEYAHLKYGAPLALVVPPTASMHREMGWGVSQSEMTPIYHQFGRAYPGEFMGGGQGFRTLPRWPSHTRQFGVYYIRGPW